MKAVVFVLFIALVLHPLASAVRVPHSRIRLSADGGRGSRRPAASPLPDTPFIQPSSTRFTYKSSAPIGDWTTTSVPALTQVEPALTQPAGTAYLLSNTTLHQLTPDNQVIDITSGMELVPFSQIASNPNTNYVFEIAVVTPTKYYLCNHTSGAVSCNAVAIGVEPVFGVAIDSKQVIYIATSNGLYQIPSPGAAPQKISDVPEVPVSSVAYDAGTDVLVAGTGLKNYRREAGVWYNTYTGGIIDYNVTAQTFGNDGTLYVGNSWAVNVQYTNISFERIAGFQGLPYANITSMARPVPQLSPEQVNPVWIGTIYGAIRWSTVDNKWQYFNAHRWLPTAQGSAQSHVVSLALLKSETGAAENVVIATDYGFARITFDTWTLAKKAAFYQAMVYPRHDRYGLTADCGLNKFGNLSSYQLHTTDNDGLWTSLYLASQSFRYAVTKDADAKANALKAFGALEFLNNVTCIKGFMGRSFCKDTDPYPSGHGNDIFRNSSCYPGWMFKADTSSDEVTGHLFTYPIFYDLVAETAEEKARAYRLIDDITGGIVEHNFTLVGYLKKPTTWGHWNPTYLNDYPSWYDERGVNSLQVIGYLLSAYRITNDSKYLDAFTSLTTKYGYNRNIINAKITWPSDDNFSDDELTWLPYFTIFWSQNRDKIAKEYQLSIDRTFRVNSREKSSLWNIMYGAQGAEDFHLDDALETLRQWPLSQIDWPTRNSQRLDVQKDPAQNRFSAPQLHTLVSYDERSMFRWNSNPFNPDGGSGSSESDPSAWLLPYWMARYYNFIE